MEDQPEWFRPTSGRILGGLAVAVAGVMLAVAVLERDQGYALALGSGAVLVGTLAWSSMLRPKLGLAPDALVLRNMLETVWVPLAAVEALAVRQVLAVRVGEQRFVSTALGRSWRTLLRSRIGGRVAGRRDGEPTAAQSYPDFVEERIRHRCEEARTTSSVRLGSAEQVALAAEIRREPAWVEIGVLALSALVFLAALVF